MEPVVHSTQQRTELLSFTFQLILSKVNNIPKNVTDEEWCLLGCYAA
jgi:hypothetical protein